MQAQPHPLFSYKGGLTMNVISLLLPKTQVAYLEEDDSIRQGLEKMRAHRYTAIPVLSKDGHYIGTVSEGDFLWHILDRQNNSLKEQEMLSIKEVLRENFNPAVKIGVSREELLEKVMQQNFVPIVDDRDFFIGIVTRQSIIRNLTTMKK